MGRVIDMAERRPLGPDHSLLFNRMTKAVQLAQQHLRYQLGLRSRPSMPAGLSERTREAVRELVSAILEER